MTPSRDDVLPEPTLAEDFLLLLFDARRGSMRGEGRLRLPLGGAVLSQLALQEHVELDDRGAWKGTTVRAFGAGPEDPLLREAWTRLERKPMKAQSFLGAIGPKLRSPVLDRLVERGDIDRTRGRVLRIFPTTRLSDGGSGRRATVLAPVRTALVDGIEPQPRDAVLAALLSASSTLPNMKDDIPWSKEVQRRGKAFEEGDWGAQAVTRAVAAAAAAVTAASVATTAAVTSAT